MIERTCKDGAWRIDDAPFGYIEVCADYDDAECAGTVRVTLPSTIDITPDIARRFAIALIVAAHVAEHAERAA